MSVNVTTGPATLSWPHLADLEARNGNSKPKVSTAVLVPKSDTATIEALKAAVREAAAEKWGTKVPKSLRTPLKDGDNSDCEGQAGHITVNASSIRRVPIVGTDLLPFSDEKIAEVRRNKEAAIDDQDFEKAASLRDEESKLSEERKAKEEAWKGGESDEIAEVGDQEIAEVLAMSTGIPVVRLTQTETAKLLKMEDELHKRVIGQDEAVKALAQSIRRTRSGLKDPNRPGGSFIFAGPTGVGKTELAKALAEFLFGDEDALIQLDMSEFSEKHTASRLFGAPPGYVGYDEGGQLTEKVRRKPFSVVLFDEVEKAHPDIFNSLLQILEEGRLTDSQGRKVDFKNTVIIMTTNLGTRDINKGVLTGFQTADNSTHDYGRMKSKVAEELKQHFRPEFLNRVDDTIVFPPLTKPEIARIVDLMIAKLAKRMEAQDMRLQLTDEARELLADVGFDPVLGARPLRRAIQREIEDALSERILFGELQPGQVVTVGVTGEGKDRKFTFNGE